MITVLRRLLIVVVVVFASSRLMAYWDYHPDSFPALVRWIAVQLIYLLMPLNDEQIDDIEFVFGVITSLSIVSIITWLILLGIKRLRRD